VDGAGVPCDCALVVVLPAHAHSERIEAEHLLERSRTWRLPDTRGASSGSGVRTLAQPSTLKPDSVTLPGLDREQALQTLDELHEILGAFYVGGAADPVRELLSEEVEWHVPGHSPIAGDYYGSEEVMAYFAKRRDLARSTFRMHPQDTLVGTEHVGVLTDGTALIAGVEHAWTTLGPHRIYGGRITACWLLPLDPIAFDSIWSQARE